MEFVSFEIAKKLKENGFREKCFATYSSYGGIFKFNEIDTDRIARCDLNIKDFGKCYNCYEKGSNIDAPTISQVLKWLRKKKKIYIEIFLYNGKYSYFVKSVTQICEDDFSHECLNEDTTNEEYDVPEQAALAGIEYVLNLIESWK